MFKLAQAGNRQLSPLFAISAKRLAQPFPINKIKNLDHQITKHRRYKPPDQYNDYPKSRDKRKIEHSLNTGKAAKPPIVLFQFCGFDPVTQDVSDGEDDKRNAAHPIRANHDHV